MTNRIYYKNNILEFIKNSSPVTNLFRKITQYNYAEKPDKEIEGDVEEVKDILLEFCFYNCLYDDRYKRAVKDFRDVVITIDTDLTKWVQSTRDSRCKCCELLERWNANQQRSPKGNAQETRCLK